MIVNSGWTSSQPRRAKIICTIGPATRSREQMRALLLHGMDVARFNFSHGGPNLQAEHIERLREVSRETGQRVAILQDLQGPKIRTGALAFGSVQLVPGAQFTLTTRVVPGDEHEVSTTYLALPRDCRCGDTVLLDDGLIALRVEGTTETDVVCEVVYGGTLKPNKGINLPGVAVSSPAMTEKDRHDVEWGLENGMDFVALSFVRRPEDVRELKALAKAKGANTKIIAKLEKPEAIGELEAIVRESDGVMVARGDLGVEMATEDVPLLQKKIILEANRQGKIVITATQMLESMTQNPRPTRAEASDVANAVLDGTDAVMLSGETASGAYPIETLKIMDRIVHNVEGGSEDGLANPRLQALLSAPEGIDFETAVCEAAAHAAAGLHARAIACFTETGGTARKLAKCRPPVPIIAFTPDEATARNLQLAWGVRSQIIERSDDTDRLIGMADQALLKSNLVSPGDTVVVTLGAPVAICGSTNLMKIHRVGEAV